ncbi:MAG: sugar phosphate nucleotidyltransferase [Planctomycetes bacterium]|nr:sugar phosphate nucleotidyltransferase [Planctomycetota bacterium]
MLHAVILAGGSGTRFWPLSRRDRPKQLLALAGPRTLLQGTWDRVRRLAPADAVHVVTAGADLAQAMRDQLPELAPARLVVEPEPRDTAIAIGLAARLIAREDPEAVLVVTPADHVVRPEEAFAAAVQEAAALAAARGTIVTLGIRPRQAHTGYGYIRRGEPLAGWEGRVPAFAARAFEEKPDRATAERFVTGGEHLWNSGVFVWRAATVLEQLDAHLPATRAAIERIAAAWDGPDREATLRTEYAAARRISIDYAVLEKARDIAVLEVDYEWSDVGSWSAVAELHTGEADPAGNVALDAPFVGVDARACFVQGDGRLVAIVGLENVAVVQTGDATLICALDRAEAVKELVKSLESSGLRTFT